MHETTLSNGLKVLVQENRSSKVVSIQVWVRVGSADEREDEAGLAHVHEHMLFKGTERRAVGAVAAEIEGAGGDINAWTSYDQTVYHVTMASRDLDVGLDVLADVVQHSSFEAGELERELEVVLEEISRGNDQPSRVVSQNLLGTAYSKHPYKRPVIGSVESVKSFTRDKILDFYRRWYRPDNMCLVVVGDADAKAVIEKAESLFEQGPAGVPMPERPRVPEPPQTETRVICEAKDIQETHLCFSWQGTPLHHADTPALDVMSVLLGSGESSRLYRTARREKQLVNDCYAYAYTPQDQGLVIVGANIHGDAARPAFECLLEQTVRMTHELPTEAEIEKAKTILLSEAVYQKETVQGVARKIGFFELVGGSQSYEDEYYNAIRAVTAQDVLRVARVYLKPETMTVSVMCPEDKKDQLTEAAIREVVAAQTTALSASGPAFEMVGKRVARATLSNGATIVVEQDMSVPLLSVRAAALGGTLAETPKTNGVTHLAGELMVRGTKRYSAQQIIERLDATACGITGVSGRNSLGLRGDFLVEHWGEGFELFKSCLLEPVFDQEEIELERKTQLEDIASRKDSLATIAIDGFCQALWKSHPYRMPAIGDEESVAALTRDDVVRAYKEQLRPDRLVLSVVGAVEIGPTIEQFDRALRAAKADPEVRDVAMPALDAWPESPQRISVSKQREQAHFVIGFPGMDFFDARNPELDVLTTILSGQGGRLFLELRDRQSLAYSVAAFSQGGRAPGYFALYIGTAQEKLKTAEAGLRSELARLLEDGVTEDEVARAQRYLIGTHEIALQRAGSRAGTMALNEAYGLGWDHHTKTADLIGAVTPASVHQLARDLIRFDREVVSVVEAES